MNLRLYRSHSRNSRPSTECTFWFYDKDQPVDEIQKQLERMKGTVMDEILRHNDTQLASFNKISEEMGRSLWGHSYGYKKVCELVVYRDQPTTYSFDNTTQFEETILKEIFSKAKRAKRRINWSNTLC